MKSLIIGMGIGNLYRDVLTSIGAEIITVDTNPDSGADYTNLTDATTEHGFFDTAHICTPNFTHFTIANQVAPYANIVFVEKPGVLNSDMWMTLIHTHKQTRFMMVKNNQWRDEFDSYKQLAEIADTIKLKWVNANRVPKPGSWFTTKELAYGGVSRDLMPHLLSYFTGFYPDFLTESQMVERLAMQRWTLADLADSDYGEVVADGVYDVDDRAELEYIYKDKKIFFVADWRSNDSTDIGLEFTVTNGPTFSFELGLCPEQAYKNMIKDACTNLNNDDFWQQQMIQDVWIHDIMTNLSNAS